MIFSHDFPMICSYDFVGLGGGKAPQRRMGGAGGRKCAHSEQSQARTSGLPKGDLTGFKWNNSKHYACVWVFGKDKQSRRASINLGTFLELPGGTKISESHKNNTRLQTR